MRRGTDMRLFCLSASLHELIKRFMFGLAVKIDPSLSGAPNNKDELIAEMKEALFVKEAPFVVEKVTGGTERAVAPV